MLKGPLYILRHSWLEGESEDSSVSEWLLNVKARMLEMSVIVSDRERKSKADMKRFYDRSAKAKTFCVGEMVLVRKPGLYAKMGDSWDGPYQVGQQISPGTYSIEVPGTGKCKLLHCNMLRRWHTPASKIHDVVTITEEESESEKDLCLLLLNRLG